MKTVRLILILILPLLILSCQSAPTSTDGLFSGKSHADAVLKKDTLNIITIFVRASGCNSIDHIDTAVLYYEPRKGVKDHIWSKEQWVVTGCSKSFPFYVTYSEDGGTGSFFKVSEEDTN